MSRFGISICFAVILIPVLAFSQEPQLVLPIGHNNPLSSVSFSSDNRYALTVSKDQTAKIWESFSGRFINTFREPGDGIENAVFSPDGKFIVTASSKSVSVREPISGTVLKKISSLDPNISANSFTADGKYFVIGSGKNIQVFQTGVWQILKIVTGFAHTIKQTFFNRDGRFIIVLLSDNSIHVIEATSGKIIGKINVTTSTVSNPLMSAGRNYLTIANGRKAWIWKLSDGELFRKLETETAINSVSINHNDGFVAIATADGSTSIETIEGNPIGRYTAWPHGNTAIFSQDGKYISVKANDGEIHILRSANTELIMKISSLLPGGNPVTFSEDGQYIIVGDGISAGIYAIPSGEMISRLRGHETETKSAQYSPDGKYILVTSSLTAKLWNASTGQLLFNLQGHSRPVNNSCFSPNGKYILTTSADGSAKIWEASTGRLLKNLEGHSAPVNTAIFSPDIKCIATVSDDNTARIWDIESGKTLHILEGHKTWIVNTAFSHDSRYLATASWDKTAKIWEVKSGKLLHTLTGHKSYINSVEFSPDNEFIITAGDDQKINKWETKSGKLIQSVKAHSDDVVVAHYMPGEKTILTASRDHTASIWRSDKLLLLQTLKGHKGIVNGISFSPDEKILITASSDSTAKIWSALTGNLLFDLRGHQGEVNSARFSPDGKQVITTSLDNTCRLWDAVNGHHIATLIALDSSEYFSWLPSKQKPGFYSGTKNAVNQLSFRQGDRTLSFEPFDLQLNRPGKILNALGNKDSVLILSFEKAWLKRIKKLNLDTSLFRENLQLPVIDIVNAPEVQYIQTNNKLTIHIRGSDYKAGLKSFNVWVNNIPVFGKQGSPIPGKNASKIDTSILLTLSSGKNKIETAVTSSTGLESARINLLVNYRPNQPPVEKLFFVGIGIDHFADSKYNLMYSCKDIRDLAIKLNQKYGEEIIIDTLFNEEVTRQRVKAMKAKLQTTSENDKVIIAYSGHGLLDKEFDYYLSTYTVDFEKPGQDGLPYDDLEDLLDGIPARKKLMLIDACHSGELDKDEVDLINASSDSLIKGLKPVVNKKDDKQLGLANSFELMQNLFVNVGKSTGATIIAAAAGTQFALERNDLRNGVFTYSILEAMNKNATMKISELKTIVGKRVAELTSGLQKPTSRNETITVDWDLW